MWLVTPVDGGRTQWPNSARAIRAPPERLALRFSTTPAWKGLVVTSPVHNRSTARAHTLGLFKHLSSRSSSRLSQNWSWRKSLSDRRAGASENQRPSCNRDPSCVGGGVHSQADLALP